MMKAVLFVSTILLNLFSGDLPKLNCPAHHSEGKCIKAHTLHRCDFSTTHSNELSLVPHVHFERPSGSYAIRTVVIDPGHGGHDPGCLGAHSREKHVALAIGKLLAEGMKEKYPGVNVILTRTEDVFVPLHERADIATRNKADLFISIHCNAFSRKEAHGMETYVLGLHATNANLEVAKRENEAILLEDNYQETYGYDPNSPEAHIMMSMFQNAFLEQSISFAEKVQSNAVKATGLKDRGVKQAGFLVLRHATMPSVLVETGYLTNRKDEEYLITGPGQREMANAILHAFGQYKHEMENGTSVANVPTKRLPEQGISPVVKMEAGPKRGKALPNEGQVVKVKQEETAPRSSKQPQSQSSLSIAPVEERKVPTPTPAPKRKIVATQPVAPPPGPSAGPHVSNARSLNEKKAQAKTKVEPNVHFCVQLAASPKLLDVASGKWNQLEQTVEVIQEGHLFKYQIRHFRTHTEADIARQKVRSKGFADAFIVAYINGEKVDARKYK